MLNRIRVFLALEAAIFILAALIHFEVVIDGYYDREAGIAESVIALALLAGLLTSLLRPAATRQAGIIAQGFALFGTLVGVTLLLTHGPAHRSRHRRPPRHGDGGRYRLADHRAFTTHSFGAGQSGYLTRRTGGSGANNS